MSKTEWVSAAKKAAKAEAHMYSWGCVIAILEGSPSPDRHDKRSAESVNKVLEIANAESQRLLKAYDAAISRVSRGSE